MCVCVRDKVLTGIVHATKSFRSASEGCGPRDLFFLVPEHNLLQKVMTTCIHTAVLDSMCSLCHMKRFGGVDA